MPGPNTTGKPRTSDYVLGRGILYAATLNAAGLPVAWRDLGNVPDFKVTTDVQTLTHESSRSGLKVTDLEVIQSRAQGVSFSTEEANHENLAMFFSGTKATVTNSAVAGFAERLMVPNGSLVAGMWYDIVNASGVRAYDIDHTHLTVRSNAGSPVTLVYNTDYEVDEQFGRILILNTSAVTTAVSGGYGLLVTLTADAGAKSVDEVRALTQTVVEVALKFISENAVDGAKLEVQFHKIKLKPSGDLELIGDTWQKAPMEGKCESNAAADPTSPILRWRSVAA